MHSTLSPLDSTWVHLTLSALDPKCSKKVECTQLECTCMWWTWVDSGQLERQSRNPQQKLWLVQWALEDSECTQIDCTQLKCTAQLDCTQVHSTRVHVVTWNPQQKPWCHYSHGLWVSSIQTDELSALDILRCACQHAALLTTFIELRTQYT